MSCSLLDIVGDVCGAKERTRHQSTQTVSLSSFSKDIVSFKTYLKRDVLLSKLINGVGNARIDLFTDIRIPSNNAGKKGKKRKILICDKVNYRMFHQFGVCGAFA